MQKRCPGPKSQEEICGHYLTVTTPSSGRESHTLSLGSPCSLMTTPPFNPVPGTFDDAVRLFNQREYFACHDVLEELWSETFGLERDGLQGLLHVAVSLHHLSEGNPAGARKMYASSLRYLANSGSGFRGVDLDLLRSDLRVCFEPLRLGVPTVRVAPGCETLPTLHWSSENE